MIYVKGFAQRTHDFRPQNGTILSLLIKMIITSIFGMHNYTLYEFLY